MVKWHNYILLGDGPLWWFQQAALFILYADLILPFFPSYDPFGKRINYVSHYFHAVKIYTLYQLDVPC